MSGDELKTILAGLGLLQADFARLIGVTPRAVALWISDGRSIPGPTEAYLRLFQQLPINLRQIELNRLKGKDTEMRDGMYQISYGGTHGAGVATLVFDNGKVFGADNGGGQYDGGYVYNEAAGIVEVKVKVTFPPNRQSIFGISNPYEWSIDVVSRFDPRRPAGPLEIMNSLGQPVSANYEFLRRLPEAA